jgi:non-specific serine/threonine protein kinase
MALLAATPAPAAHPVAPPAGPLTRREREVAALVARGLSNRAIAEALSISEKTVANHLDHILTKLDFRSRAQVAAWAVRSGFADDASA